MTEDQKKEYDKLLHDVNFFGEQILNSWNKCRNCQPNKEGKYIVCVFDFVNQRYYVDTATWFNEDWYCTIGVGTHKITDIISHWMELPDIPEDI